MTKSQNTKNEQQKDLCITSEQLTEQWKQGELPEGWYYVKGSKSEGIYAYTAEYLNNMYRPRNGEIIIEQVPSYEEWQASYNCMLENEVLRLKNAQLKELLKECKEVIKNVDTYYGNYDSTNGYLVINKIDEVVHHINENKLDNTPENLLVLTQSEHIRLHANKRKRGKNGKFEI